MRIVITNLNYLLLFMKNRMGIFILLLGALAVVLLLAKSASVPFDEDSQLAAGSRGPAITNVQVLNITSTSATFTWTTDAISSSQAKVRKVGTNNWISSPIIDSPAQNAGVTSHTVTMSNLLPSTTYYYRVKSCDVANNCKYQPTTSRTFQTLATGSTTLCQDPTATNYGGPLPCTYPPTTDTQAPTVPTGLTATAISSSGFTLSWVPSTDNVTQANALRYDVYGPTTACNVNGSAGYCGGVTGVTTMNITGLTAGTTYSGSSGVNAGFLVQAYDAAGNYSQGSARLTVTTTSADVCPNISGVQTSVPTGMYIDTAGNCVTIPDTTAPTISSVSSSAITTNGATISWTTNEAASRQVIYGTVSGSYPNSQPATPDQTLLTSHGVQLTSLVPGTRYYFKVKSTDASGNTATSSEYNFTTAQSPVSCGNATTDPYGTKGMWIWSNVSSIITPNSSAQNALFAYTDAKAISRLYLYTSASTLSNNATNLKDFLNKAQARCVEVWAMDGEPSWIAVPNSSIFVTGNTTNAAVTFANAVKNINASITGSNAKFVGISYDVEPHGLKSASYPGYALYWNDADASSIQKLNSAFIEMIDRVKTTLAGSGIPIDVTIARWNDTRSEINAANNRIYTCSGSVTNCTATTPGISVAEMVFNRADHVTLMNYVTNATSFYNDGKDELAMAIARGKKVTLAVETVSGQGTGTSFYGSTCQTLNNMLLSSWSLIQSNGRGAGLDMLAVHEYASNAYLSVCP